ncbi:MAG: prepilin peptidase, partial [Candidatus Latescibacteria bacterium]|nr:prepilin peptidase [Candidatus Latescibacterota bacterium]
MVSTHWIAGGAVLLCCTAAYWDLRHRRIPNAITFPAVVIALCLHGAIHSGQGLLLSLAGAVVASALLLPGYAMGFTGAGDVKLLAAVGAFVALPAALFVGLLSLALGGVLSLIVSLRRRGFGDLMVRTLGLGRWLLARSTGAPLTPPSRSGRGIPLGVAIALATVAVA